jgi:hypothetical protein
MPFQIHLNFLLTPKAHFLSSMFSPPLARRAVLPREASVTHQAHVDVYLVSEVLPASPAHRASLGQTVSRVLPIVSNAMTVSMDREDA